MKTKISLSFAIFLWTIIKIEAQVLNGRFRNEPSTSIIYLYIYPDFMGYDHSGVKIDSAEIINGYFDFKLDSYDEPRSAKLIQKKKTEHQQFYDYLGEFRLFLSCDSVITVHTNDSLKNINVFNSKINYDHILLQEWLSVSLQKSEFITDGIRKESKRVPDSIRRSEKYRHFISQRKKLGTIDLAEAYESFITSFPESWISLYAFVKRTRIDSYLTQHTIEFYDKLNNKLKASHTGKSLGDRIARRKSLLPGSEAPDFSLPNKNFNQISLSDRRGKFLLLEFWNTSCAACRAESPHLKAMFEKYNEKGFDILSVSLDNQRYTTREKWLAAIEKDGTNLWEHVTDFKGWESPVAICYDIQSIPQNYLIDPYGKIISENLKGFDLHSKLMEIFGY